MYQRTYTAWGTRGSDISIVGFQCSDGRPVEREIVCAIGDCNVDAGRARRLAALLIEPADELDRLQ